MKLINVFTEKQIQQGINPISSEGTIKAIPNRELEYNERELYQGDEVRVRQLQTLSYDKLLEELKKENIWFAYTQGGAMWDFGTAYVFHQSELIYIQQTSSNVWVAGYTTYNEANQKADKFNS